MNVEHLRSFCAVVEQGSFTRAARSLHLTQPAVSQHVRALEQRFGVPLIDRIGRRMQPTQAGALVHQHALEVLAQVGMMQSGVDALKGLRGGRIVLGAGYTVGNYVLPQFIARFRQAYPEVRVELRVDSGARILEQVLRGTVDFGVALGFRPPAGLAVEPLFRDRLVPVVSPSHPILSRWPGRVPLAAVADLPMVALAPEQMGTRRLLKAWLEGMGVEPRLEMEFDTVEPIKRVVAGGVGAAFLYYSNVALEVQAGQLKILDVAAPPLYGQFVVARRPRQTLSPAALKFLEEMVGYLQHEGLVNDVDRRAVARLARRQSARRRRIEAIP